jgi:tetratricopeptide (TPR) repeat protein
LFGCDSSLSGARLALGARIGHDPFVPARADVERGLTEAIAAYKAQRYRLAEALVDELLGRAPSEPAALQLKALLAHLRGDPRSAVRAVTGSLAMRPGHPPTLAIAKRIAKTLAAAAEEARAAARAEEAVRDFRSALELDPGAAPVWFSLGLALQDSGQYADAAGAFAQVLALDPSNAKAMVNHGVSLQQTGDLDGAWASYRSAYKSDPSTFAAICQALPAASVGTLILNLDLLRQRLSC